MEIGEHISWNEFFMGVAILASKRSKDPRRKVGACIVSRDNKILSTGYNGFPKGCSDLEFPWKHRTEAEEGEDYKDYYVVHAELNAILNATTSLENSTLYVDLFPCNECAKAIIQVGIRRVVYLDDRDHTKIKYSASDKMFYSSGVQVEKMEYTDFLTNLENLEPTRFV